MLERAAQHVIGEYHPAVRRDQDAFGTNCAVRDARTCGVQRHERTRQLANAEERGTNPNGHLADLGTAQQIGQPRPLRTGESHAQPWLIAGLTLEGHHPRHLRVLEIGQPLGPLPEGELE